MNALDKALEEALRRHREGAACTAAARNEAGSSAKSQPEASRPGSASQAAPTRTEAAKAAAVDPWSPEAILRAANEDDDLYDPYSDYMDALARSSFEEPCADPWR